MEMVFDGYARKWGNAPRGWPGLLLARPWLRLIVVITLRVMELHHAERDDYDGFLLCQHLADNISRHIGEPKIAAVEAIGQARVIEAHEVQHRRLDVVNAGAAIDRFV